MFSAGKGASALVARFAALPPGVRAFGMITLGVGILFALSSWFGWGLPWDKKGKEGARAGGSSSGDSSGSSPPSPAAAASPPASLSSVTQLIRIAAESATKAGKATNPYQQLLHVQWAMANLQAARKVSGLPDDALSEASGIHVAKLEEYLKSSQQACIQQLEANRAGAAAASGQNVSEGAGNSGNA